MLGLSKLDTGYTCPVCGNSLEFKAWEFGEGSQEICPCCGTQFGYTDAHFGHNILPIWREIRQKWIKNGMKWGWSMKLNRAVESVSYPRPSNWDPIQQLKNIPAEFLDVNEKY